MSAPTAPATAAASGPSTVEECVRLACSAAGLEQLEAIVKLNELFQRCIEYTEHEALATRCLIAASVSGALATTPGVAPVSAGALIRSLVALAAEGEAHAYQGVRLIENLCANRDAMALVASSGAFDALCPTLMLSEAILAHAVLSLCALCAQTSDTCRDQLRTYTHSFRTAADSDDVPDASRKLARRVLRALAPCAR